MAKSKLPPPPIPADCDLSGVPAMLLEVDRLLSSDLWSLSTGEECKAALALWLNAWKQRGPSGSLPTDERILAKKAEVSLNEWRQLAPMALRGWYECSDGRLYHNAVAGAALLGWIGWLNGRKRGGSGNAKRYGHAFDAKQIDECLERAKAALSALAPNQKRAPKSPSGTEDGSLKEGDTLLEGALQGEVSAPPKSEKPPKINCNQKVEEGGSNEPPTRALATVPPTRKMAEAEVAFAEWYEGYPRKEKRQDALRAFKTILKSGEATADELSEWRDGWFAARPSLEPRYVPLPASWLNGKRWQDAAPAPPVVSLAQHRRAAGGGFVHLAVEGFQRDDEGD